MCKNLVGMLFGAAVSLSSAHAIAAEDVFSAAGASAAAIQGQVDAFRTSLGTLNANVAGSFASGRREINWDGVPDALSAPNNMPANFFNVNSPRGAVFSGPASGFKVSGNAAVGAPTEFSEINATYRSLFTTFSAPRLFTALGSPFVDVLFFVPGSTTPAVTTGFGAVFTDVDLANDTSIQFFGVNNNSLGVFAVPNTAGNATRRTSSNASNVWRDLRSRSSFGTKPGFTRAAASARLPSSANTGSRM